ncbi:hypothetical protein ABT354_18750 [Streptomyces sp. NPDC000594]|uniref:hypothetical protein n=1 Tax=Streptomyces sp. NPDC000594 TaxID=3154261 RepID=UPI003333014A
MTTRTRPPWLSFALAPVLGGIAGYGADRLSRAARRACRTVVREHGSLLDWWSWQTPLSVLAGAAAGLTACAVASLAVRRGPRPVRIAAPVAAFTVALTALTVWHFIWIGTPAHAASDTWPGSCAPGNTPHWAPDGLPTGPPLGRPWPVE